MSDEIALHKNDSAVQQRLAAMFAANKDEIAIPKIYIDMTGDFKAAAVLDELMFWTLPKRGKTSLRVFRNGGLWLAVRRSDWWDRKRLSERQSDTAIAKLVEIDLIEKDVFLFDGKPTVHIRIKMANFVKLLGEKMQGLIEEEDGTTVSDIADLYEMMGFPNQTVISNSPNGEMLNLQNGEIINNLQQPPTTSMQTPEIQIPENEPKRGSQEWKDQQKKKMAGKSLDWVIAGGEDISQEDLDSFSLAKEAKDAFEVGLKFNPLPWSSTKEWEKLEKFVVQEYQKDKLIFTKYKTWQINDGKYVALSNRKIKASPEDFIACWPDFLAHSAMSAPKTTDNRDGWELDDHGAPISY